MALVRILVDGYSVLHNWPELACGLPRHSAQARDELLRRLTQYRDATGVPITVFFDGSQTRAGVPEALSTPEMEVLYSRAGQTADQMIERAAYRLRDFGEVLVVTDDYAERDTVLSLGAMTSDCATFIQSVKSALGDLGEDVRRFNRRENRQFKRVLEP